MAHRPLGELVAPGRVEQKALELVGPPARVVAGDEPSGVADCGGQPTDVGGYDGTAFAGWAAQRDQRTVQGELEAALATIARQELPRVTVAVTWVPGPASRSSQPL